MNVTPPPDLPLGQVVENWSPPPLPLREEVEGRFAQIEPMEIGVHGAGLFDAFAEDHDGRGWTYLPYGPFSDPAAFEAWLEADCLGDDPLFFAVRDLRSGAVGGMASFLNIRPDAGSIEIGHIHFAPRLQRRPASTEALYLMMRAAFELGYRRVEWKCNALNAPSRAAAQRLGFSYEGVFRQATVVKGRNRDHAWYAAVDGEWPALDAAFRRWLARDNFDADGRQRTRLSTLTAPILVQTG